ncbi:hypothetical protein UY3_08655 [Chelonia mydas]|uniref:Uncharacterized protein n=1 Tax=Chelonia mydas TaxID=8469 RepID=M7C1C7_CHEMY|nr:hypothetical protein UY3_08655 [Chelonia mydas]
MVHTAPEHARQQPLKSTALDRAAKKLDLLGRKVYLSVELQFHITNYQALLVKYDFHIYSNLAEFQAFLLSDKQQDFQVLLDEGKLVTKMNFQPAVDAADIASSGDRCHTPRRLLAPIVWVP